MTALTINGRQITADIPARTHLADYLRETLRLTGTHLGCEHGVCGACTILLDGEPARACLTLPALCGGAEILTIEGLEHDPITIRLREAFSLEHALQCGYCTPGMLITARDIILRLPAADDDQIRLELAGNLCRCTGYGGIVRAIRRVLDEKLDVTPPERPAIPAAQFGTQQAEQIATAVPTDGLHQHLAFPFPAEILWTALHDPALLATCIPGASIEQVENGRITGAMQIALGPIRVRFSGHATVAYDEPARTGTVTGGGNDRGGTSVTASAAFRVEPDGPTSSLLHVDIDYALRGALAQLARGRVVDLLAAELGAQFGRTLTARLAGEQAVAAPLRAGSLGWRVVLLWLRQKLLHR